MGGVCRHCNIILIVLSVGIVYSLEHRSCRPRCSLTLMKTPSVDI